MVHLQSGFVWSLFYMCAFQMNTVCVVCVWLHLIEVCFLFMTEVTNPNGWSVFVCVVGPGFDSTSPAFVRSRASQQGATAGLPIKRNRAPIFGGRDCVDTICADVCSSQTSCRRCLLDHKIGIILIINNYVIKKIVIHSALWY